MAMNKLTLEILDSVEVGALATAGADGAPVVTPLHFARYNEEKIIWVSDRQSRHSLNLSYNNQVEFVVWDSQKRAVFLTTEARELPESETTAALAAYASKLGDFLPRSPEMQVYVAPIGKFDENSTTGNWLHYIA